MTSNENRRTSVRPQNKSCPAGGTFKGAKRRPSPDQAAQGSPKRGVIVAPPSRNTDATGDGSLQVVHLGFDTLEVAIRANLCKEVLDQLTMAKAEAEKTRDTVQVMINGMDFNLSPHGGGGYRFLLDAPPYGARWAFKQPHPKDPWGIRVKIGSTELATQGLGRARAHIDQTLTRLGTRYSEGDISIGRVDFCVDILAPDLAINPDHFVMHSHSTRADYLTAPDDIQSHGKSGRFTSVTIGKMPGRQVILYDKRREVIDKGKVIWWDIWNNNLRQMGRAPLDPKDAHASRVLRIEVRAGKHLLKDRWNIRQWPQLDDLFGDLVAEAMEAVRYCEPDPADANRARWPNHAIWDLAIAAMSGDLMEMRSHLPPDQIKAVNRAEHIRLIERQVVGSLTTLGALEGVDEAGLAEFVTDIGPRVLTTLQSDWPRTVERLNAAKGRYRFL